MTDTKALQGVEIKDAAKGTVQAVFSRLNVKDHDGDVTRPGAFEEGAPVRISAYGHASWGPSRGASGVPIPPVGKGVIRMDGDQALLDGQFFLNTTGGRDTFELVKEMGDLQEWSYGYDVTDSQKGDFQGEPVRFLDGLKVHEVSPVMLGAGIGTGTVSVKEAIAALGDGLKTDLPFSEQADGVLGDITDLLARAKAFGSQGADPERKEGRVLSAANRERLAALAEALGASSKEIADLLAATDPNKHRADLTGELLRFERLRAHL